MCQLLTISLLRESLLVQFLRQLMPWRISKLVTRMARKQVCTRGLGTNSTTCDAPIDKGSCRHQLELLIGLANDCVNVCERVFS